MNPPMSVSEYRNFVGLRHSGFDPGSSLSKQFWIPAFAGMTEKSGIPTGSWTQMMQENPAKTVFRLAG